ncbi:SIR2 family protein [Alteraurantiacibacter aquimixticola]|uniref:SIR2 family protein n=1 Tax=Alteraurantiacibacter aquimixticola TaxID=2489173 RepID=A0A4T3F2X5_9SPHN|nr:SIR2 family protein [Alteraurantiacibacter aquimixticola]TIX51615.1 SIR2 family protein [Alteraurantiacibacter aquimixticola]
MTAAILDNPAEVLADLATRLRAGEVVPYLGPGISELAETPTPMTTAALADFLGSKVRLPARAIGNVWAAAQYIESYRHRQTVTALMQEAFATPVEPSPLHRWLAELAPPLVVDSWYAGEMRRALSGREGWVEVQGTHRAVITDPAWYRFYMPDGTECEEAEAEGTDTLLYTPHGSIAPAGNFLISDADYVEVLTEIDIQTPIPEEVRRRRTGKSFLFLGCHFDDQLLRTYARQVMKRSGGAHYAVVEVDGLTRNECRFLEEQEITAIDMPLDRAIAMLLDG